MVPFLSLPFLDLIESSAPPLVMISAWSVSVSIPWCAFCLFLGRVTRKRQAYRDSLVRRQFRIADDLENIVDLTSDGASDITQEDIRNELMRDPVATDIMVADDTPGDVQRYLYLEALRRARMRKLNLLGEADNDFFAAPRSRSRGTGS